MDGGRDVDSLIARLNAGDPDAYDRTFQLYYEKLVRLARGRLSSMPPQVADDEGAVISALGSFYRGVQKGRFEQLVDQHELWKLLVTITIRKSIAQLRRHHKQSGEGQRVDRFAALETIGNSEPTPDQLVEFVDECETLVSRLSSDTLQQVALLRLQGFETREIADSLDLHPRSVQRKLLLIKSEWAALSEAHDDI